MDSDTVNANIAGATERLNQVHLSVTEVPGLNPLLVDMVLENIFKYLPAYDLMKYRAVCTLWNNHATQYLDNRMDMVRLRISDPVELQDFMDTGRRSSLKFRNLLFIEPIFNHPVFKSFFESPREEITEIALCCTENNPFSVSQFRELLVHKLPSLKKLELFDLPSTIQTRVIFSPDEAVQLGIKSLVFHVKSTSSYSARCLTGMYMATPQLQEFTLKFGPVILRKNHDFEFWQWKSLTLFCPFAFRMGTITSFEFTYLDTKTMSELAEKFTRAQIRSFTAKRVHLEDGEHVLQFLETHREVLEVIQLDFDKCEFQIKFPETMKKLETLCIFFSREPFPTFETLNFGANFKSLQKFKIRFTEQTQGWKARSCFSDIFSLFSSSCATVTELELPEELEDCAILRNIERIFPNVRKLNYGNIQATNWSLWPSISDFSMNQDNSGSGKRSDSSRQVEPMFHRYFDEDSSNVTGLYSAAIEKMVYNQEKIRKLSYMCKFTDFS